MRGAPGALAVLGALAGMAGVGLAAYGAHASAAGHAATASRFLLWHAPALIGIAALMEAGVVARRVASVAGLVLAVGLALFCGDLALREWAGRPLFRMAAPAGGIGLMAGWGLLALSGLAGGRR